MLLGLILVGVLVNGAVLRGKRALLQVLTMELLVVVPAGSTQGKVLIGVFQTIVLNWVRSVVLRLLIKLVVLLLLVLKVAVVLNIRVVVSARLALTLILFF